MQNSLPFILAVASGLIPLLIAWFAPKFIAKKNQKFAFVFILSALLAILAYIGIEYFWSDVVARFVKDAVTFKENILYRSFFKFLIIIYVAYNSTKKNIGH